MDKETWMRNYINTIKHTDWTKHKFEVKRMDYGGPYETLKQLTPNILRILKKP